MSPSAQSAGRASAISRGDVPHEADVAGVVADAVTGHGGGNGAWMWKRNPDDSFTAGK